VNGREATTILIVVEFQPIQTIEGSLGRMLVKIERASWLIQKALSLLVAATSAATR
jgi:hypothetical protein